MKKSLFISITLLLFSISSFSRVLRVGYNGTPLKGVDFTSITEANDSAKVGDTIQIYGTQGGSINKRLVILGFGYNLNAHQGLQSNPGLKSNDVNNPSVLVGLSLEKGSDSSIIEGCQFGQYPYYNGISIKSQKAIIRRCTGTGGPGAVYLYNYENSVNEIKIINSNLLNVQMSHNVTGDYGFPCKSIQIFNCINSTLLLFGNESTGSIINCIYPTINSYGGSQDDINSKILIKNCIVNSYSVGNYIYDNNIFLPNQPVPTLPGMNNKWGQLSDSIFIVPNPDPMIGYLDENNYQLRPNSPAKDFGIDLSGKPTDCGIFGGELAYRYKIGGQPAIPAFYKLSAPTNSASSNPYNITVSVRSNN